LVLEQHLIILLENGQMRSRQSKLLNFDVVLIFPPGTTRSVVTGYSMRLVPTESGKNNKPATQFLPTESINSPSCGFATLLWLDMPVSFDVDLQDHLLLRIFVPQNCFPGLPLAFKSLLAALL
jgi:hypothetical protein